jgi:hypothetical protein
MCVGAECIAVRFGGEGDGGDDETVYGQRRYREGWLARADLVDVVQDEEQAGLLFEWVRPSMLSKCIAGNRGEIMGIMGER